LRIENDEAKIPKILVSKEMPLRGISFFFQFKIEEGTP